MMNFSSCCMSQNVFISPLFLKDFHWVKDSRLKVFFFSFQCFKEGAPHLLVFIVSDKKKICHPVSTYGMCLFFFG